VSDLLVKKEACARGGVFQGMCSVQAPNMSVQSSCKDEFSLLRSICQPDSLLKASGLQGQVWASQVDSLIGLLLVIAIKKIIRDLW